MAGFSYAIARVFFVQNSNFVCPLVFRKVKMENGKKIGT